METDDRTEWSLEGLGGGGDVFGGPGEGVGGDEVATLDVEDEPVAPAVESAGGGVGELEDDEGVDEGGTGESASELRRQREGGRAPFNEFGRAPNRRVGQGSALRNLEATKIEGSRYTWEALEELAENGDDPGVQEVFRKLFAGKHRSELAREFREGRKAGIAEGRQAVLDEMREAVAAVPPESEAPPSRRERTGTDLSSVVDGVIGVER